MLDVMMDEDRAYAAFEARDRSSDGAFVVAVRTTHIYCKPSCPARRPRRENIAFYADGAAARAAGYRPCLRCRPDEVSRDGAAVRTAIRLIGESEARLSLEDMARAVGYAPHHFHRLFKRDTGMTPAAYARGVRADRLAHSLRDGEGGSVTQAIYRAGYEAPSRAYADAAQRLGMTPSAWKQGGAGEVIRHAIVPTSLGPLLVAATDRGLCRIAFDEDGDALRNRFPGAEIVAGDAPFAALVRQVVALVDGGEGGGTLPLDLRGTAFQQAVWQALLAIPPGETRSYAQIAAMAGRPRAVRAVGTACGDNPLPLVVPCHRVLRADGGIGGYAYGVERKKALLAREAGE